MRTNEDDDDDDDDEVEYQKDMANLSQEELKQITSGFKKEYHDHLKDLEKYTPGIYGKALKQDAIETKTGRLLLRDSTNNHILRKKKYDIEVNGETIYQNIPGSRISFDKNKNLIKIANKFRMGSNNFNAGDVSIIPLHSWGGRKKLTKRKRATKRKQTNRRRHPKRRR